jgi:hypothetical protein
LIKPKKRLYDFYDDEVIKQTSDIINESVKQGVEIDYDETLNKLQEIKNIEKRKNND